MRQHFSGLNRVHACRRLVEHEQGRLSSERPGDFCSPSVGVAQGVGEVIRPRGQTFAEPLELPIDAAFILGCLRAQRPRPGDRNDRLGEERNPAHPGNTAKAWPGPASTRGRFEPNEHVLAHREIADGSPVLECSGKAGLGDGVWPAPDQFEAIEQHRPGVWPNDPGDEVERCGLAGSVGSDDAHDLAAVDGKRDTADRLKPAEASLQVRDIKQVCDGHGALPTPVERRRRMAAIARSTAGTRDQSPCGRKRIRSSKTAP